MTKVCARCKVEKPITEFACAPAYRGGVNAQCRVCRRLTVNESYARHREHAAERFRKRYRMNLDESRRRARESALRYARCKGVKPKRVFASEEERRQAKREYQRRYRERHPDRRQISIAGYIERHPERVKVAKTNSKAKEKSALGIITARQWKAILLFYGHRCARCGASAEERPLTVDHYVPLSKGGANDWRNVWPLCLPCNITKHARVPAGQPPHVATLEALEEIA